MIYTATHQQQIRLRYERKLAECIEILRAGRKPDEHVFSALVRQEAAERVREMRAAEVRRDDRRNDL